MASGTKPKTKPLSPLEWHCLKNEPKAFSVQKRQREAGQLNNPNFAHKPFAAQQLAATDGMA